MGTLIRLAALGLALGCQAPKADPSSAPNGPHTAAPPPAPAPAAPTAATAPEQPKAAATVYTFRGKPLRLEHAAAQCEVVYPADAPDAQRLTLELAPPCHLLVWRETPQDRPSAEGQSDGKPVGQIGEPEAWHYPSAKDATVIAVIGDPVPKELHDDVHADRVARGYHCGGSLQGVLFRRGRIALGVKRANIGETCAEIGMDEKGFWLLAH